MSRESYIVNKVAEPQGFVSHISLHCSVLTTSRASDVGSLEGNTLLEPFRKRKEKERKTSGGDSVPGERLQFFDQLLSSRDTGNVFGFCVTRFQARSGRSAILSKAKNDPIMVLLTGYCV